MNKSIRYGLTTVYFKKTETIIYHGGNMDSTIDRCVRPDVDQLFGTGAFDKIREVAEESGSPDYIYTLILPTKTFKEITKQENS